ncbi:MAG: type III pantothenate kinase [Clostridia bacterium]|nr:type III pantothenate kinase [Clostridia bacterium]
MLLVMDMGNTCITLGIYNNKELKVTARLATDRNRTSDQYAVDLHALLTLHHIEPSAIQGSILGSVVPSLNSAMIGAVQKVTGITPLVVGSGIKTRLNIKIDDPAQTGADLVCGAVAAVVKYPMPCIVYDLGTATTITVLNEKGEFLGGTIAAGIGISLDALSSRTSQLPHVSLKNPDKAIGTNTVDAMKSGLIYGTASMMDGMADRIEQELGCSATLVATGGRAGEVIPYCKRDIVLDDNLLLEGLRILFEKNQKK